MDEKTPNNEITLDIVEKLRTLCLFYVKLDMAIIVSVGTIISIMKLNTIEVFQYIVAFKLFILALFAFLLFGIWENHLLILNWAKARHNETISIDFHQKVLSIFFVVHVVLISLFLPIGYKHISENVYADRVNTSVKSLREGLNYYLNAYGDLPVSLGELEAKLPDLGKDVENLRPLHVDYSYSKDVVNSVYKCAITFDAHDKNGKMYRGSFASVFKNEKKSK